MKNSLSVSLSISNLLKIEKQTCTQNFCHQFHCKKWCINVNDVVMKDVRVLILL